jgi:hypothetical protein
MNFNETFIILLMKKVAKSANLSHIYGLNQQFKQTNAFAHKVVDILSIAELEK